MPDSPSLDTEAAPAAAVLRAQAALLSHEGLAESASALAVELAQLLGCSRASVGLLDGGALRVAGSSGSREVDQRLEAAALLTAAMHEALDQSSTLHYPAPEGAVPMVLVAQQALAGAGGGAVCTVPVKGMQDWAGAITLERAGAFSAAERLLCEDAASFAGPVLALKLQAQQPWWRRAARGARRRWAAPGAGARRWALGVLALLLAAVLAVPLPYGVSAPARLEGSVQRAIVASADGYLQQANVRAGDLVKQGQVLAEMASQDLQLERRRRESEFSQHENAYRAAQARNDRAQMVISQSKAGEAQAMLQLADSQIERARITAPFDGIVIKGDLSQTLGAPVQRGEVLLTLAPNDSFRLIVEVDEADIGAIAPGQPGRLALAAVPDRALAFTTRRIVPVATSAEARNYFEVEATLDAAADKLRPGLSGVAQVEAGRRTLAWQLTHRLVNWLRLSLWSLGL